MDEMRGDYASLIGIVEVLYEEGTPYHKPDFSKKFEIYLFDYIGGSGYSLFILIKNRDKYTVYRKIDCDLIIDDIIKIRKKEPEIISDELFIDYVNKLVELKYRGGRYIVNYSKHGRIEYLKKLSYD